MSGCCAIHYSAAVVTQYTTALMFYLKWHVIAVLNLLENVLFKARKTWRRGTCLSCTVIAWKSIFYEACTTYKIWNILCLHINGNNPKMAHYILLCFMKYSRRWGGPVSAVGEMVSKPLSRSRTAVKGPWILYVAHHKYSHLTRGNSAVVSSHEGDLEQSGHSCCYHWNQNTRFNI